MTSPRLLLLTVLFCLWESAVVRRPVNFVKDFKVTWADTHVRQVESGRTIQLTLDQSSGCGFASRSKYMFGRVSMKIKLIAGDSAGTVTAPTPSCGITTTSYSMLIPPRSGCTRTMKRGGSRSPSSSPWECTQTLCNVDNWATRGGQEKIDRSKPPFFVYGKDFDIEGCTVPGAAACASSPANWWEVTAYQQLSLAEAGSYRWVRINHMIHDCCADRARHPAVPSECRHLKLTVPEDIP